MHSFYQPNLRKFDTIVSQTILANDMHIEVALHYFINTCFSHIDGIGSILHDLV